MRLCPLAVLFLLPASALAQATAEPPTREVALVSRTEERALPGGRFALTLSLGPGFFREGFSGGAVDVGLSGAVSIASVRASWRLAPWMAVQLGAAGALAVSPTVSTTAPSQRFGLEKVAGFGLLGGGVVFGARAEGLRFSLLGGVAWTWAALDGSLNARSGAGPGGGAFVELSHHWVVGETWTLGLGAAAWGLFGQDVGWLAPQTPWNNLGGGLLAVVSTR